MEAILRSRIQKMSNTSFIFSGCEYSLLGRMFESPKRPFYKSATPMELSAIPLGVYRHFADRQFSDFRKSLNPNSFDSLYSLFNGFTFYIHYTLNVAFMLTAEGESSGLTSEGFLLKHGLHSTSMVQSAARSLEKKKIISRIGERYYLNDKFEGAWIIEHYLDGLEGRLK